ncbi:MAG: threonine synthase, partial [Arcobacteraceae bacterium]|nr:threonine synthase [Arcobacteraceae bacterium]
TCLKAYENLKTKPLKAVMYSTAEWTKFSPTVLNAIKQDQKKYHDKEALEEISQLCDTKITKNVKDLFGSIVIHKNVIDKENIEKEIINFIQN